MTSKIFSYITLVTCLFFSSTHIQASSHTDFSILVSSCDKYAQFWDPFFALLDKHWPELNNKYKDVNIYLIANSKKYADGRVQTINIPNEVSWSDNMLLALDKIHTKYIVLFLDDYWLNAKVNDQRFTEIFDALKKQDAAYVQLFVDLQEKDLNNPVKDVPGLVYKNKFQKYRASLQLAIWETKALKQLLRSGESAWDFEMAASIRSSGYPKEFLTLKENAPISYLNASYQGHMRTNALELAKEKNPKFVSLLPILEEKNWDLKVRHMKHRVQTMVDLLKRNLSQNAPESYRYIYEENK